MTQKFYSYVYAQVKECLWPPPPPPKKKYRNNHSTVIHNSLKVEATKKYTNS